MAVIDAGISDHHAVRWHSTAAAAPSSVPAADGSAGMLRSWHRLDMDDFREALSASRLCLPALWPTDVDELCTLYCSELTLILDRLLPLRRPSTRRRPTDPWFDADCRAAKRSTQRLERQYAAACRRLSADAVAAKAAWYCQRRSYRQLRRQKCREFWLTVVEEERFDPRRLWQTVDRILGRSMPPLSSQIDVDSFAQFFECKVSKIRESTADASLPTYTEVPDDVRLPHFADVTIDDVITAIGRLPNKSSFADPIPTPVLKSVSDLVAPYLTELFNRSLSAGYIPRAFKHAAITPIVKKAGLDLHDVNSYRPISNFSVVSKLLERLVARQLLSHLNFHHLLPPLQSGFRSGHSTETAVIRVLSDILSAVDRGDFAALVLLDLSAAFDTVDHDILIERLRRSFGITDSALRWFQSYLSDRTQCVWRGSTESPLSTLRCGVPQGSVLGPLLFVMFTADLPALVQCHCLSPHLYADDTQVYGSCRPADVYCLSAQIVACVDDVACRMKNNRLQLNAGKTDLLWCTTARRQHLLPVKPLAIGGFDVAPATSVRDLGVIIDADLSFRCNINAVVSRCFGTLRQLRSVRQHVPPSVLRTLVTTLVLSRLDYNNAIYYGLPAGQISRLQSVQNAAARLVFGLRRFDHITDALICLHWLRVRERITFKMAVLVYRALHNSAPSYLSDFRRVADISRRSLRSANTDCLVVPRAYSSHSV